MRSSGDKSLDWSSYDSLGGLNMLGMSRSFYDSVETAVFVYGVLDSSDSTVSFVERVFSVGYITFTGFFVGVNVTGVLISNSVFELVMGWSLKKIKSFYIFGNTIWAPTKVV